MKKLIAVLAVPALIATFAISALPPKRPTTSTHRW